MTSVMDRRSIPPLLVLAAGVVILVYQWAVARPMWLDEEMIAVNFRDRTLANLHGGLWLDQSAPLGWMYLQRLMFVMFGSSELVLRAVPAAFGVGTLITAYVLGRRYLNVAGATVLIALCGLGHWISFHAGELKSYSADTFFGLLLPALTVFAADAVAGPAMLRWIVLWAAAAAVGHWLSLGALLVLPACAAVLAVSLRLPAGSWAKAGHDAVGIRAYIVAMLVVGVSVAAHYFLNIQHAQSNESLQQFWEFAFPPREDPAESARWLFGRLAAIPSKPGGTSHIVAFWVAVVGGIALARNRALAAIIGLVILSGLAFGVLRLVPLYERLSLWMVPSFYVAIAIGVNETIQLVRQKPLSPRWLNAAIAGVVLVTALPVTADVIKTGLYELNVIRIVGGNHATDDRAAVRWLIEQRRPGDALVTTRHALPAVWWYGGVPVEGGGRRFPDGGRIFAADYYDSTDACQNLEPASRLRGQRRILLYLGFEDMPAGFDDLLLEKLSALGAVTALREFTGNSRAAVVDTTVPGRTDLIWSNAGKDTGGLLDGCIAIRPARAW